MPTAFAQRLSVTLPPLPAAGPAAPRDGDAALAAGGDRRAFERLYRSHLERVFALCVRMTGDRVRAEELTQDAFVRAWERLPQFRGEASFATWLHRLTVNVVLEARRRDRRSREEPDADDRVALAAARPAPHGERLDLAAAVASLPPGARAVFALHDVEGYTHEEIGRALGITPGGSKAQLHRARRLLREVLR